MMKQKGHACRQAGFTLIELLVTMGIIAVLTGMAVFNFNQSRMRARDVQRKSDLGQLIKALELYKIDNGAYPGPYETPPDTDNFQQTLLNGEYAKVNFNDPKGTDWGKYMYVNPGSDTMKYSLMACLENKADSVRAAVSQCTLFPNNQDPATPCICGGTSFSGVMYVVSNP